MRFSCSRRDSCKRLRVEARSFSSWVQRDLTCRYLESPRAAAAETDHHVHVLPRLVFRPREALLDLGLELFGVAPVPIYSSPFFLETNVRSLLGQLECVPTATFAATLDENAGIEGHRLRVDEFRLDSFLEAGCGAVETTPAHLPSLSFDSQSSLLVDLLAATLEFALLAFHRRLERSGVVIGSEVSRCVRLMASKDQIARHGIVHVFRLIDRKMSLLRTREDALW